jgi:hypothetical protein
MPPERPRINILCQHMSRHSPARTVDEPWTATANFRFEGPQAGIFGFAGMQGAARRHDRRAKACFTAMFELASRQAPQPDPLRCLIPSLLDPFPA